MDISTDNSFWKYWPILTELQTKNQVTFSAKSTADSRAAQQAGQVRNLPHHLSTLGQLKIAQAEIYFSVTS